MKFSQGSPQQQQAMNAYRAHAKAIYTEKLPCSLNFAAEVELLEALLRQHWSREQAATFMAYLLESAWDFYSPFTYIEQWIHKAIEAIENGMTFEELQASGLFEQEGNLFPIDNIPPAHLPYHELMAFEDSQRQTPKPLFKDQIAAMIKQARPFRRNNN